MDVKMDLSMELSMDWRTADHFYLYLGQRMELTIVSRSEKRTVPMME